MYTHYLTQRRVGKQAHCFPSLAPGYCCALCVPLSLPPLPASASPLNMFPVSISALFCPPISPPNRSLALPPSSSWSASQGSCSNSALFLQPTLLCSNPSLLWVGHVKAFRSAPLLLISPPILLSPLIFSPLCWSLLLSLDLISSSPPTVRWSHLSQLCCFLLHYVDLFSLLFFQIYF